jgi:hypothetical protein
MSDIDTGHRPGCSFGRTARCNCTYLAQWGPVPQVDLDHVTTAGEHHFPAIPEGWPMDDVAEPPVAEGYTRHYPEGGGFLDIPTHLNKAFLTGQTS